jgi:hypothetical protein
MPRSTRVCRTGVPDCGFGDGASGDSEVESGEMMTVEMIDEVGSREAEGVIEMVHKAFVTARGIAVPVKPSTWFAESPCRGKRNQRLDFDRDVPASYR